MTEEGLLETVGRARWARLAALGFLLAALGPIAMLLASLVWGLDAGDEVGFFSATAMASLGAAALVRRDVTWMRVVAMAIGLAAGFMLFWTAFGLAEIDSFFDFFPGVVVLPGTLLGIGAGIAAQRAAGRGDRHVSPTGGERSALLAVPAVVLVLGAASAALTLAGQTSVDASDADVTVRMTDFEFEPQPISADPGDVIFVKNDDPFHHTFTIDALGIDVALSPGSEALVTLPEESGEFVVYCEPHTNEPEEPSADDMAATLDVG